MYDLRLGGCGFESTEPTNVHIGFSGFLPYAQHQGLDWRLN